MAAITKADLAENLFNTLGLNKTEAKEIVEALFEEIAVALEGGAELNFLVLVIFTCATKNSDQVEIQKPD